MRYTHMPVEAEAVLQPHKLQAAQAVPAVRTTARQLREQAAALEPEWTKPLMADQSGCWTTPRWRPRSHADAHTVSSRH